MISQTELAKDKLLERVAKAIFADDPDLRIGTQDSDVNPLWPVMSCRPEQWEVRWAKMHPHNRGQMLAVARAAVLAYDSAPLDEAIAFWLEVRPSATS